MFRAFRLAGQNFFAAGTPKDPRADPQDALRRR